MANRLVDGDTVLNAAGTLVLGAKGYPLGATIVTSLVASFAVGLLRRQYPRQLGESPDPEVGRFAADMAASVAGWYLGHMASEQINEAVHEPVPGLNPTRRP